MKLEHFPGNDALKDSLRTALNHRFPQAILLTGVPGSGKTELAQAIAAALLCTGSDETPCMQCHSCRKIAHGTHPDLIVIDQGADEIKVETARRIREEASILPNDGSRKVFLIHHADRMNVSAQNALLKVLEEPPRYVFFILTSAQPSVLLQTIRSRCTGYQLEPPQTRQTDDPAILEPARQFLQSLAQKDEYAILVSANGFAKLNKTAFQQAMTLLGTALRDAALYPAPPLVPALSAESRALSGILTTRRLLAVYDHLMLLSNRAERNASAPIQCAVLAAGAYQICCQPADFKR